ncbi:EAL domain-containing protein [Arcobacter sp. LA11]|uniref:EAL domain-containing protein n=1 Tax=Arcobacter sp. LA11 TaxID=1898176 RepID=UPI000932EC23|nr:EAL domain-containing protein [Arcobacter sp. LA11]
MSTKIDVDKLDFAFQPIVNTYSGKTYAVEALIRNTDKLGFESIQDFFDELNNKQILFQIDILLRKKAIEKFKEIELKNLKLFYNIDNRILTMPDFKVGETSQMLKDVSLKQDTLCFEITEHHSFQDENLLKKIIHIYKKHNFNIAIDDFGTGISGLHLLYIAEANFIKLDRFFIHKINSDSKKRLFCSSIVEMAHIMGIKVIAEGIETIEEYYTCKDIKADYIQGYLIAKPSLSTNHIQKSYSNIRGLFKKDRRAINNNFIDKSYIERIVPLNINSTLHELFLYFKENTQNTFVPIINNEKKIEGVIYEVDIKELSYSQYGLSLAKNISFKTKLRNYMKPVLEIDISWGIDKALEIFNMRNNSKGIFVRKDDIYYGFINLNNLLSLSYKRNLEIAQNQNPLTKLPGNKQIDNFIHKVFKKSINSHIVYFDFNDFKPFNDHYGFRQGDRAILMFSEILQKNISNENFIAHIGGDDFFVGFQNKEFEYVYSLIHQTQEEFKNSVSSLYSEEDLKKQFIISKDRFGVNRKFNLLSISAAIIEIKKNCKIETFNSNLGKIKKLSKENNHPLGICCIL